MEERLEKDYILRLEGLEKSFLGKTPILKEVTFRIRQGEFIFLTGVSGAGKTTIFKMLLGLEKPSQGQVFFQEKDVVQIPEKKLPYHLRKIGAVFQDYKLLQTRTVEENISIPLLIAGTKKRVIGEKVKGIAREMDIAHLLKQKVMTLSGGEQQLTGIARAAVTEPPLLLADEPTANLDRGMAKRVLETLKKVHEKGATVIIATHDVQLIKSMNCKVFIIKNTGIVEVIQKEKG